MSMENVKKFQEFIKTNEAVKEELRESLMKYGLKKKSKEETSSIIMRETIKIAGKNGFDLKEEDLIEFLKASAQELSEEDLLNVSGGFSASSVALGLLMITGVSMGGGAVMSMQNSAQAAQSTNDTAIVRETKMPSYLQDDSKSEFEEIEDFKIKKNEVKDTNVLSENGNKSKSADIKADTATVSTKKVSLWERIKNAFKGSSEEKAQVEDEIEITENNEQAEKEESQKNKQQLKDENKDKHEDELKDEEDKEEEEKKAEAEKKVKEVKKIIAEKVKEINDNIDFANRYYTTPTVQNKTDVSQRIREKLESLYKVVEDNNSLEFKVNKKYGSIISGPDNFKMQLNDSTFQKWLNCGDDSGSNKENEDENKHEDEQKNENKDNQEDEQKDENKHEDEQKNENE